MNFEIYADQEGDIYMAALMQPETTRDTSIHFNYVLDKGHTIITGDYIRGSCPEYLHGHLELTWSGTPDQVRGVLVFSIGNGLWSTNFRLLAWYEGEIPETCYYNGVKYDTAVICKTDDNWLSTYLYHNGVQSHEVVWDKVESVILPALELCRKFNRGLDMVFKPIQWLMANGLSHSEVNLCLVARKVYQPSCP